MQKHLAFIVSSLCLLPACWRDENFSKDYDYHSKPACELNEFELASSITQLDIQIGLRGGKWSPGALTVPQPVKSDMHDAIQRYLFDSTEYLIKFPQAPNAKDVFANRLAILDGSKSGQFGALTVRDERCGH